MQIVDFFVFYHKTMSPKPQHITICNKTIESGGRSNAKQNNEKQLVATNRKTWHE
jgi:hypothetical protein